MAKPLGYSRLQIRLHWVVAILIAFQVIFGEEMGAAWRQVNQKIPPDMTVLVWGHIVAGFAIWVFAAWRLYLRFTRGVPAHGAGQSRVQVAIGEAVVWVFYAIMLMAPITGALAWFGGVHQAGEAHEMVKPVIIGFVALHVLAALYHQFILKDGLLMRMKQPAD